LGSPIFSRIGFGNGRQNMDNRKQPMPSQSVLVQLESSDGRPDALERSSIESRRWIVKLQLITIGWMFIECGVSSVSAWRAHSSALLAFGTDSFVELLSAMVVLVQFTSRFTLRPLIAARMAGALLLVLAAVVTCIAATSLIAQARPDTSWSGMIITAAALLVMPLLSRAKWRAARMTGNRALAADAVQSATCAYLAAITLIGLTLNAAFHMRWIDPLAALIAIPVLCIEAGRAMRGQVCDCC